MGGNLLASIPDIVESLMASIQMRFVILVLASFLLLVTSASTLTAEEPELRWWRGNLHTHSLWSDGDDFPEMIGAWYLDHGYNFLALSDHNILSDGQRWMKESEIVRRGGKDALKKYRARFGQSWVQTRGEDGTLEVRLKPLNEFGPLLNQSGKFLMIPGEEISDRAEGKPVHINATNVAELIRPAGGATVAEAMQNNLRAILAHEKEHGRAILPHLNHPNFGYAVTASDLASVTAERFFEVYNGHPGVNQLGDKDHPSVERIWDLTNAIRRTELDVPPIMGIATDDSHDYHGTAGATSGRGWVMVRSRYLTAEHLINAMKRGDFYASSGVVLRDVSFDESTQTLTVDIAPKQSTSFRTDFVATLRAPEGKEHKQIGVVVATSETLVSKYRLKGNELYVRAVITSTTDHPNPSYKNQKEMAWTQPVGWHKEQQGEGNE